MIEAVLHATPLFWPGTLFSALAAVLCRHPLGRRLGATPFAAFLLVFSLGGIVTLTLLPNLDGHYIDNVRYAEPAWQTSWHIPRLAELAAINQQSLNVALFVPLGVAIARLRPRVRAVLTAAAAAVLPFGIEATQYALPWLLRAADSQDIASNLLGLALGLTALALPCRGANRQSPGVVDAEPPHRSEIHEERPEPSLRGPRRL
ncbi:VanZ family protein [Streptomyces herbicida]|uniref:VanZ family protein n=1 Tax=Streptomyces herbicida TaxID=3065675 RepID=UPI0029319C4E|nr:VanZ family protein [Streptomyces sp. NEAU-HV9]